MSTRVRSEEYFPPHAAQSIFWLQVIRVKHLLLEKGVPFWYASTLTFRRYNPIMGKKPQKIHFSLFLEMKISTS